MAAICDKFIPAPYATMPLMTYENTYFIQEKSTILLPPASPEAGRKENCAGHGNLDKIVHDFRSSLNIIIGYTELMLEDIMGNTTEEQRDSLKDILSSSRRMIELVNQVSGIHPASRT